MHKRFLSLLVILVLLSCFSVIPNVRAPVETRYMRSDTQTVNGLTVFALGTSQTTTTTTLSATVVGTYFAGNLGIRVFKRTAGGVETEITAGVPIAVVQYVDGDYHVIKSNTWSCPQTALASTDSIVVRVYRRIPITGTWTLLTSAVFTTEQLGASQLDTTLWTVYYSGSFTYNGILNRATIEYYFGSATDDSRITNFSWSVVVAPEERSFAFTETMKPSATLNQWQEQKRIFTETITITSVLNQWQEQKYVFQQTITPLGIMAYWQEQSYIFSEIQILSTTLNQWQEQFYSFTESIKIKDFPKSSVEYPMAIPINIGSGMLVIGGLIGVILSLAFVRVVIKKNRKVEED